MVGLRLLLMIICVSLAAYTAVVIAHHGMGLLPVFFGDISKFGWPGQFNLDFLFMLILSALWAAWRHHFSVGGLALAALALNGGALFLSVYLLILTVQEKGNLTAMLIGRQRGAKV